jgi:two-component system LytT family response regulator
MLRSRTDVTVVGECADGASGVQAIRELKPDLVFLDVQMPELNGFGVLEQLGSGPLPFVIFITAHDQFALKAFEVHAVDYLLKPFEKQRFLTALDRALDRIAKQQSGDLTVKLGALLSDVRPASEPRYLSRLAVKSSGRVVFIKVDDIDWVEASDNYVNLHVGADEHLHRETMSAIESHLPPDRFLRISRSAIVNVDRIKELQPLFHGEYAVILKNGTRLTLSRSYRDKLDQLMK